MKPSDFNTVGDILNHNPLFTGIAILATHGPYHGGNGHELFFVRYVKDMDVARLQTDPKYITKMFGRAMRNYEITSASAKATAREMHSLIVRSGGKSDGIKNIKILKRFRWPSEHAHRKDQEWGFVPD